MLYDLLDLCKTLIRHKKNNTLLIQVRHIIGNQFITELIETQVQLM